LPELVTSTVKSSDDQTIVVRALHVSVCGKCQHAAYSLCVLSTPSSSAIPSSWRRFRQICEHKKVTSMPDAAQFSL
jgi:hypothetical protein